MLNHEERRAIEGLFRRLSDVERTTPPRDREAEQLIESEISRQPAAPYYMAQTILVQERALEMAERRIRELEERARRQDRGSDIFGDLFGGGGRQAPAPQRSYEEGTQGRGGPWDRQPSRYDDSRGGGFLAGAAQTALGVTGGLLIGNAIASMFGGGGGEAQAAETPQDVEPADSGPPETGDAGGDDFGGFDDGGGFDMGGDF